MVSAVTYPVNDPEFRESTIKKVDNDRDGWCVTFTDGWSFFIPQAPGIAPKKGQTVRLYGRGIGYTVRGAFVNGVQSFYRTEEQQRQKDKDEAEAAKQERIREYEENREETEAKVASLPEVFRSRIEKFRAHNPDFRTDLEGYEIMCSQQAVLMAETFKTTEELQRFSKMDWGDQIKALPGMDQGHSGNSFGFSVRLASLLLVNPELVRREHGALVHLVGCEAYGCHTK